APQQSRLFPRPHCVRGLSGSRAPASPVADVAVGAEQPDPQPDDGHDLSGPARRRRARRFSVGHRPSPLRGDRRDGRLIDHAENGAIRMLLAGDAMPSRRLMPFDEPDYLALVELLRSADITFVNLETTVRNRDEGAPGWTQGTPMTTPPVLVEDLKWMGFGLLSNPNNHPTDYGTTGLIPTLKHTQTASLPSSA